MMNFEVFTQTFEKRFLAEAKTHGIEISMKIEKGEFHGKMTTVCKVSYRLWSRVLILKPCTAPTGRYLCRKWSGLFLTGCVLQSLMFRGSKHMKPRNRS